MKRRLLSLAALVTLSGVACIPALADTISIFNTGSNGVSALPTGGTDPHYTLVSAPGGQGPAAITTVPNSAWVANQTNADWISPSGSGTTAAPAGTYDYRTSFTLTAGENPATAMLSGMWSSDNDSCIVLNGAATGICIGPGAFGSLNPFTLSTGFVTGANTLDFVVNNIDGPTGVIAEVSGTVSTSPVPEPSSLLLFGTVLAGAGLFYRRLHSVR